MVDDAELERRIAETLAAQQAERQANPVADTPLWLSHHWPSGYHRCTVIAGRHICRRCVVLYPVAILTAFAAGFGLRWPTGWDPWIYWLAPLPGVIEFCLDTLGLIRHNPRRQMIVSALLAVTYGNILYRYAHHPGDPLVWTVVLTQTGICGLAAIAGTARRRRRPHPDTP